MNVSEAPVRFEQWNGPLAFLADVHGNLPALDAVIDACRTAGAQRFFVAGDLLLRGDQPLEVWKRLVEIGARCTRGTSDMALAAVDPDRLNPTDEREREAVAKFRWTQRTVGELILARLRRLPDLLRIELRDGTEIAVVHGSPADPTEAITHDLDEAEISALLGTDPADVVVCSGSEVPFVREVGGVRVVNVGSVGDGAARVAHFTLIEPEENGLAIQPRWVRY